MPTESELVHRAMRKDAAAFGQLYELHLDSIYRYIYYRVGNAAEAEDLTEQVFLKAWEHIGGYDDRGLPFAAWLYRMAHNQVIDYRRTRKVAEPLSDLLVEKTAGPEETAERHMEMAEVAAALRSLSPDQQQIIILRFVQGCTHAEAAAIMGRSEGALRALQCRALTSLHDALQTQRAPKTPVLGTLGAPSRQRLTQP
jgi:RNA polymerase sigma-70 factor (ECF subfamily)